MRRSVMHVVCSLASSFAMVSSPLVAILRSLFVLLHHGLLQGLNRPNKIFLTIILNLLKYVGDADMFAKCACHSFSAIACGHAYIRSGLCHSVCALHAECLNDNWQPYPRHNFSLCCHDFPGDVSYFTPYRSVMIFFIAHVLQH